MPSQYAGSDHAAAGEVRNQCEGAEAYPFDPRLRFESQRGLDRLRCIADRALAADFFAIFQAAERNTETALLAEREQAHREDAELKQLSRLATRALAGELGSDETEDWAGKQITLYATEVESFGETVMEAMSLKLLKVASVVTAPSGTRERAMEVELCT